MHAEQSRKQLTRTAHLGEPMKAGTEEHMRAMFDVAKPIIKCPPGATLKQVGVVANDGGKFACGLESIQAPCMIFSLGSNNDYSFEEDMLRLTPCNIATFDCTMAPGTGRKLHATRHTFFEKCIGSVAKAAADPAFVSLLGAMNLAGTTKVDVLKMDIEGFEFDVMAFWGTSEDDLDASLLPLQVLVEIHSFSFYSGTSLHNADDPNTLLWPKQGLLSITQLALFFGHLGELGYATVSLDKNVRCPYCAEYAFLRVATPN